MVLAAEYFSDDRLTDEARGGVASKHRHRIHLSLFGQLMASFEYMLKDFVAKVIDSTDAVDDKLRKAKWIEVDASRVLASRFASASPGAMLIHPSLGWHTPEVVNSRYVELFSYQPVHADEIKNLERLWILRHSVAHNAGFVINHDAARIGSAALSERVVAIDGEFISSSFTFLCPIAQRVATEVGDRVLLKWLESVNDLGPDFDRDGIIYCALKKLATFVQSRPQELPTLAEADYLTDFGRV